MNFWAGIIIGFLGGGASTALTLYFFVRLAGIG